MNLYCVLFYSRTVAEHESLVWQKHIFKWIRWGFQSNVVTHDAQCSNRYIYFKFNLVYVIDVIIEFIKYM